MRKSALPGGRSINLVLTARGLRALSVQGLEGLKQDLINMSVPVLGRMMHSVEGELTYTAYGKDGECNFSISREELNKFLMTEVSLHTGLSVYGYIMQVLSVHFFCYIYVRVRLRACACVCVRSKQGGLQG